MVFDRYSWRPGYRGAVPASVAGERLALLDERLGGHVTPPDVVADARPPDAPLHRCFTWDDSVAGERWREDEARRIIRNCYVVYREPETGRKETCLGRVSVTLPDVGTAFVTTRRAVFDDALRGQIDAEALRAYLALRKRYDHIASLKDIHAAIDEAEAKSETKTRPKRQAS
jgi:hypothetical protein